MLFKAISCFLLLIPVSTANSGFTVQCEGERTTLSCFDPRNYTEGEVEINALWKKGSGERVIWKLYGHTNRGDTFKNRTVNLNDNLSLSIDGCDLSDQGIYIFCINGKPSCHVKLLVKDSKHCKPKTFTEQSTTSSTYATEEKQNATNENHLHETNIYIRWVVYAVPCFVVLIAFVFLWFACACIQREETSKNNKSGFKLIHKDEQINCACAGF